MKIIKKISHYIKDNDLKIVIVNNSINIINYDNILEVSDNLVNLIKDNKIITIKGSNLKLNKLLDNEVLIQGLINKIELGE